MFTKAADNFVLILEYFEKNGKQALHLPNLKQLSVRTFSRKNMQTVGS